MEMDAETCSLSAVSHLLGLASLVQPNLSSHPIIHQTNGEKLHRHPL